MSSQSIYCYKANLQASGESFWLHMDMVNGVAEELSLTLAIH